MIRCRRGQLRKCQADQQVWERSSSETERPRTEGLRRRADLDVASVLSSTIRVDTCVRGSRSTGERAPTHRLQPAVAPLVGERDARRALLEHLARIDEDSVLDILELAGETGEVAPDVLLEGEVAAGEDGRASGDAHGGRLRSEWCGERDCGEECEG